jgi:hypothetical protein
MADLFPGITALYGYWPKKDLAVAVAVNGGSAREACEAVMTAVRERYAGAGK